MYWLLFAVLGIVLVVLVVMICVVMICTHLLSSKCLLAVLRASGGFEVDYKNAVKEQRLPNDHGARKSRAARHTRELTGRGNDIVDGGHRAGHVSPGPVAGSRAVDKGG